MTTDTTTHDSNHISSVRAHLLATLAELRKPDSKMDVARARAISEVAQTIINSAKVEVEHMRATKQTHSPFFAQLAEATPAREQPRIAAVVNTFDEGKPMTPRTNWVGMKT